MILLGSLGLKKQSLAHTSLIFFKSEMGTTVFFFIIPIVTYDRHISFWLAEMLKQASLQKPLNHLN
jgi:hypothetical protein